jgi:multiple RNA-binding domain-containing protein 1
MRSKWRETTMLTRSQISDELLPKSRRQQKVEKSAPQSDDYFPPSQDSALKRKREEPTEQDPKLKEFLEVYQAPSKNNIWANGESQLVETVAPAEEVMPAVVDAGDESDNEYQVITKKPKTSGAPSDDVVVEEPELEQAPAAQAPAVATDAGDAMEDVQETNAAEQGPVSDADWLRSRTNRVLDLVEDDEEPKATAPQSKPVAQTRAAPKAVEERPEPVPAAEIPTVDAVQSEEDKIRDTGRLYLRNLHFEVAENEIRDHFSKYGSLQEVRRIISFHHTARFRMNVKIGTTDA